MKTTQVRIPKRLLQGVLASLGAFVLAGIVLELLAQAIPASPIAQINQLFALNPGNSQVYNTYLYRHDSVRAEYLDAFVLTPMAMLAGGLVLGVFTAKAGLSRQRALRAAAVTGAVIAVATQLADIGLTDIAGSLLRLPQREVTWSVDTMHDLVKLALVVALSTAAYTLGALVSASRTTARPPAAGAARPTSSRPLPRASRSA